MHPVKQTLPLVAITAVWTVVALTACTLQQELQARIIVDEVEQVVQPHPGHPVSGYSSEEIVAFIEAVESEIHRLTNEFRRQNGLAAINRDSALDRLARNHSVDMVMRNFYSHTDPDGVSAWNRMRQNLGRNDISSGRENIAWRMRSGQRWLKQPPGELAKGFVDGWINSAGHRRNILSDRNSLIGVGVSVTDNGDKFFATQKFVGLR